MVAAKSEQQSQAQAQANTALAESVKSEQAVETARAAATADREADRADRREPRGRAKAIAPQGRGRGARRAASKPRRRGQDQGRAPTASPTRSKPRAKQLINEAINVLSSDQDQSADQARADPGAAFDHREVGRADEADRRHQDRRRSMDSPAAAMPQRQCAASASGRRQPRRAGGRRGARLPRAQSPIIDGLLKEIGMTGGALNGLSQAVGVRRARPAPYREADGAARKERLHSARDDVLDSRVQLGGPGRRCWRRSGAKCEAQMAALAAGHAGRSQQNSRPQTSRMSSPGPWSAARRDRRRRADDAIRRVGRNPVTRRSAGHGRNGKRKRQAAAPQTGTARYALPSSGGPHPGLTQSARQPQYARSAARGKAPRRFQGRNLRLIGALGADLQ